MTLEFNKRNGNGENGNGIKPLKPDIERIVAVPRCQSELDRRRSARRKQPREKKKQPK